MKMSLEELREFLQENIAHTFIYSDDVVVEQLQASMTELRKMKLDLPPPGAAHGGGGCGRGYSLRFCRFLMVFVFSGKPEELPRNPLGQELPVLLSPLQAGGLHISSASPAPRDPPLPSPDPIIIHSQAPPTPDGSPLTGPPPYRPPEDHSGAAADRSSPLRITDAKQCPFRGPWTLGPVQSGSPCAAEQQEETSAWTVHTDQNQDQNQNQNPSEALETQPAGERLY